MLHSALFLLLFTVAGKNSLVAKILCGVQNIIIFYENQEANNNRKFISRLLVVIFGVDCKFGKN